MSGLSVTIPVKAASGCVVGDGFQMGESFSTRRGEGPSFACACSSVAVDGGSSTVTACEQQQSPSHKY